MTYATIMVHLDAARPNSAVLDVTAALARRYGARVIGIAACQPLMLGSPNGYFTGEYAVVERDLVDEELHAAKVEFEGCAALASHELEWRSIPTLANIALFVANEARSSDLVIVGTPNKDGDAVAHANVGDLVRRAGRPVLVVPETHAASEFETIVVAWKDTGECRRAIVDALPLLKVAGRITVVAIADDSENAGFQVGDVVLWLGRQGLSADRVVAHPTHGSIDSLAAIATEAHADLLVAGAYGHSRLREWMFGGTTRDLLSRDTRCVLLSH